MKALIKRASFSILLIMSAPFAAIADLIDAQWALLNGQFSEALEFAHDIADTRPVDAALISARALIELGNPKEAERYAAFAVRVAPKSFSARLLWPPRSAIRVAFGAVSFSSALPTRTVSSPDPPVSVMVPVATSA